MTDFRAGEFTSALFQQALESWLKEGAVGEEKLSALLGGARGF
jgi:hypothetical protein